MNQGCTPLKKVRFFDQSFKIFHCDPACVIKLVKNMTFDTVRAYAERVANRQLYGELVLFANGHFDTDPPSPGVREDDIATFKSMMHE